MHGTYYDKDKRPAGVVSSTHSGNSVNNTGGTAGKSTSQKPIPGPESTGGPVSLKKALAKKSSSGGSGPGLPNKSTSFPGSVR